MGLPNTDTWAMVRGWSSTSEAKDQNVRREAARLTWERELKTMHEGYRGKRGHAYSYSNNFETLYPSITNHTGPRKGWPKDWARKSIPPPRQLGEAVGKFPRRTILRMCPLTRPRRRQTNRTLGATCHCWRSPKKAKTLFSARTSDCMLNVFAKQTKKQTHPPNKRQSKLRSQTWTQWPQQIDRHTHVCQRGWQSFDVVSPEHSPRPPIGVFALAVWIFPQLPEQDIVEPWPHRSEQVIWARKRGTCSSGQSKLCCAGWSEKIANYRCNEIYTSIFWVCVINRHLRTTDCAGCPKNSGQLKKAVLRSCLCVHAQFFFVPESFMPLVRTEFIWCR